MSIQTHDQIMQEQFNAVLSDFQLWAELYRKTGRQSCRVQAAERYGMLRGLAIAAKEFGIPSLQAAFDELSKQSKMDGDSSM